MSTRNVILTEHHEQVIDRLLKSGRYQDASEVMREGLRLIEHQEAMNEARLAALQEACRIGFADIDEGRFIDVSVEHLDDFIDDIGREVAKRAHG
jgi:antitoxin ParD1/3/4